MFKIINIYLLLSITSLNLNCLTYDNKDQPDLTIVGFIKKTDGIGQLAINCIDALKNDIKINFIQTRYCILNDVNQDVEDIVKNTNTKVAKVTLLLDALWHKNVFPWQKVPNTSIKLAYSMIESTSIPKEWPNILNQHFDAVIVPDDFYVNVYQASGVKIPIFVLPPILNLTQYLSLESDQLKNKIEANKKFKFGVSASFTNRKNHELLIKAFSNAFKDNPEVKLKIHGRGGSSYDHIIKLINDHQLNNVKTIKGELNELEYTKFLLSLNCYILISLGEGFSISPREALSLAKPCILSNNTAHKTICKTGYVKNIESKILQKAYYDIFPKFCGYHFNCTQKDVEQALLEVYKNYSIYCQKALEAREWVKQYDYNNIKAKYLTLIKPNQIILSTENKIENNCLKTNSKILYQKYLRLIKYSNLFPYNCL